MSRSYAIFSARYRPLTGGIETFTASLAHALASRGDRVAVVTDMPAGPAGLPEHEEQADGVAVVRLPARSLMGGRLPLVSRGTRCRELLDELAASGVDRALVNARFYEHSVLGLDFAARAGAPAVLLDHGSDWLTFGSAPALDAPLHAYERAMTARVVRRHPAFAGISARSAAWLRTFGICDAAVVPNAIDADAFRAEASGRDFRAELGAGERPLVAFVGRLTGEKGPLELAEAARLLGPGAVFALAGEGPLREEVAARGLPNVHLLGRLGHPDLSSLLAQASVLCLPTRSEGFCTALLEAGAWGVPCVVPDVGGAREVLLSGAECFGVITRSRRPEAMAEGIRRVLAGWTRDDAARMAAHVRRDCGWDVTVRALDAAFGDADVPGESGQGTR